MRRPLRWMIAAVAWVFVAAMPAQAASPGTVAADGSVTITGTLQVVHADDFAHGKASFKYALHSANGWFQLDFAHPGPMDDGGATVQVTGRFAGGHLEVADDAAGHGLRIIKKAVPLYPASGATFHHDANGVDVPDGPPAAAGGAATPAPQAQGQTLAAAATPVSVAVVLLNFSNDTRQTVSPSAADGIMFSDPDSVANFFAEESRGTVAVSGTIYGWYTIADTNAGCDYGTWQAQAEAMAQAAGVDLGAFQHVVFAWPLATSCAWAGMGFMPGGTTWNNGEFDLRVLSHELSHNFGTNHASTLQCRSGVTIVSLSATCSYNEYGDPFSVMGSGLTYHNDGEQLGELGFLKAGELATVQPGGTYTLTPLLGSPAGSVKVLRVARASGTSFFLDVRATFGPYFDKFAVGSAAVNGVMVRLSADAGVPQWAPTNTMLVDTTPGTLTYLDAPLAVGQALIDPVSHITITTLSLDASGATVRITESVPPSPPGVLSGAASGAFAANLSWSAATDNIAVTGYRVARDGVDIATLAPSARTFHDTGLTAETGYHYTVVAFDGSGNDSTPASVVVTTTPDDSVPPTAPTNLTATPGTTTVALAWTAGTDDKGIAGYRISRDGVVVATVSGTSWTDTHRTPKTAYAYDVVTLDRAANTSPAASTATVTLADTKAPTAPKSLKTAVWHTTWTALTWKAATDDVAVAGYRVYRVGTSKPVTTTKSLSVHVRRVKGARYFVRAFDAAGHLGPGTPFVRSL